MNFNWIIFSLLVAVAAMNAETRKLFASHATYGRWLLLIGLCF